MAERPLQHIFICDTKSLPLLVGTCKLSALINPLSTDDRAHDVLTDFTHRTNEAAINTGNQALRALIIINGGAAVTVLAFIGHLVSSNGTKLVGKLPELTAPLIWFAWGVALATLGVGLAYLANYSFARSSGKMELSYDHPYVRDTASSKHWRTFGVVMQVIAVIAALVSLALFVWGMIDVRDAIQLLVPKK